MVVGLSRPPQCDHLKPTSTPTNSPLHAASAVANNTPAQARLAAAGIPRIAPRSWHVGQRCRNTLLIGGLHGAIQRWDWDMRPHTTCAARRERLQQPQPTRRRKRATACAAESERTALPGKDCHEQAWSGASGACSRSAWARSDQTGMHALHKPVHAIRICPVSHAMKIAQ